MEGFNLETIDDLRVLHVKKTFEAMAEIMADKKASAEQKIAAGELVHKLSDTIVKERLLTTESKTVEKTANKLLSQLDKLTKDDQED